MKYIIIIILIASPLFIISQADYDFVTFDNVSVSEFSNAMYIGQRKAVVISEGAVYELAMDDNFDYQIKFIENSGIDLNGLERFDINNNGNLDLLAWSNGKKGVLKYLSLPERFDDAGSYFGNSNILSFITLDFDEDGKDEMMINGSIYKKNDDGTLTQVTRKLPSNAYSFESLAQIDIDQDGDLDFVYKLVTNIGYLENTGVIDNSGKLIYNQKNIGLFSNACDWLKVIKTLNGSKIIYYDKITKSINQIILDTGDFSKKVLISDYQNTAQTHYVLDLDQDGNEEILMHTKYLNELVILEYNAVNDSVQLVDKESFLEAQQLIVVDDIGELKLVGINATHINIYEFDESKALKLIKTSENTISSMTLNEKSFVDFDGDSNIDLTNSTQLRKYFGKEDFGDLGMIELPDVNGVLVDFDGDQDADYVTKEFWYEHLGDGVFGPQQANPNFKTYPEPEIFFTSIILEEDLDGDGDIDLLSYNSFGESLFLHENINNESFSDQIEIADYTTISGKLLDIRFLDLNKDGKKDILMTAASGLVWFEQESALQFDEGDQLYTGSFRIRSIDVRDGNDNGFPDIVIGSGKISAGSLFGETVLFRGTLTGPVLVKVLESNAEFKKAKFIDNDNIGAMDVLVGGKQDLYIYNIDSYDTPNIQYQAITNDFEQFGSFEVLDVDGDNDEDIIVYDDGGVAVRYYLKNEDGLTEDCPVGNVILRNQDQVDDYNNRFGSCPEINGDLFLGLGINSWADIKSLEAFAELKTIKGDLYFNHINGISDYTGFRNLERIEGDFTVFGLKHGNFNGFQQVKTIGGNVYIHNAFTIGQESGNFDEFESLDSLGGGITVVHSSITDINGLLVNNKINGDIKLMNNTNLSSLDQLSIVDTILGNIEIRDCLVSNMDGLANLQYFEGLELGNMFHCKSITLNPNMDSVKNSIHLSGFHVDCTLNQTNNIKHVGGNFILYFQDIGKWHDLESVGETFGISTNGQSADFSSVKNLNRVLGNFSVSREAKSFKGLENLDTIGKVFYIQNTDMNDMSALNEQLYVGGQWNMVNNTDLSVCDINAFCNHLKEGRDYFIFNNAVGCNSISDIKCLENSVTGFVFYDYNENGLIDSTDATLSNVKLIFNDGQDSLITSNNGFYQRFLEEGDAFSVATAGLEDWKFTTEDQYEIDSFISNVSGLADRNFGMVPKFEKNEIQSALSNGLFVCDREFELHLFARNAGTKLSSGYMKISFSDQLIFHSDNENYTSYDSILNEIIIEYTDLYPYFNMELDLLFTAPGAEEIENTNLFVKLEVFENNEQQQALLVHENQIILHLLCSFDPNDKQVNSTDNTGDIRVGEDDELIYTIRFQNTGNYYAEDIRVTDVLSADLDISTFQFVNASHDVRINIQNRKLSFLFEDIYLIDSTSNFIESQGFVTFKIKPINSSLGYSFPNKANIYFDFNEPIITNEVISTVYDPSGLVQIQGPDIIKIYPQPCSNEFSLVLEKGRRNNHYMIYNLIGEQLLFGDFNSSTTVRVDRLNSGIYVLVVFDEDGNKIGTKKLSIIK